MERKIDMKKILIAGIAIMAMAIMSLNCDDNSSHNPISPADSIIITTPQFIVGNYYNIMTRDGAGENDSCLVRLIWIEPSDTLPEGWEQMEFAGEGSGRVYRISVSDYHEGN
jgi:hypothetical protein